MNDPCRVCNGDRYVCSACGRPVSWLDDERPIPCDNCGNLTLTPCPGCTPRAEPTGDEDVLGGFVSPEMNEVTLPAPSGEGGEIDRELRALYEIGEDALLSGDESRAASIFMAHGGIAREVAALRALAERPGGDAQIWRRTKRTHASEDQIHGWFETVNDRLDDSDTARLDEGIEALERLRGAALAERPRAEVPDKETLIEALTVAALTCGYNAAVFEEHHDTDAASRNREKAKRFRDAADALEGESRP